jgi:hypothetical protein
LGQVRIRTIFQGDLRDVLLSTLRVAMFNSRIYPFLSRTIFFLNSMIINMNVTKSSDQLDVYIVDLTIKEVVRSGLVKLKLAADLISYGYGKKEDLVALSSAILESGSSTLEVAGDVLRSSVKDISGFGMNESDPLVEAAIVSSVKFNEKGQSFNDLVG